MPSENLTNYSVDRAERVMPALLIFISTVFNAQPIPNLHLIYNRLYHFPRRFNNLIKYDKYIPRRQDHKYFINWCENAVTRECIIELNELSFQSLPELDGYLTRCSPRCYHTRLRQLQVNSFILDCVNWNRYY